MASEWTLRQVDPKSLTDHPVSLEIYGKHWHDDELLKSIKEFGVLNPCRATKDGVILSGHRRRFHAVCGKVATIPCLFRKNAMSDAEQVVEIVEDNRTRDKTVEQKAREFTKLAAAKAELAKKRKEANLKKGAESPERENFSTREAGRAKDQAAAEVGMSRPTAERAVEVVQKIDELEAAGDKEQASEIRETLNHKSVSAAHKKATEPKTAAAVNCNGKLTVKGKEIIEKEVTKAFGAVVRLIDKQAGDCDQLNTASHRLVIDKLNDALTEFKSFTKECQRAISRR